jgi:hypothetical protein
LPRSLLSSPFTAWKVPVGRYVRSNPEVSDDKKSIDVDAR